MRQATIVLVTALIVLLPVAVLAGTWEPVYKKGQAKLVEVMKIGGGAEDSEDEVPFYRPMNPCVGHDGTIYVLDYQATEVSAFSAAGEFLVKFAREGEG